MSVPLKTVTLTSPKDTIFISDIASWTDVIFTPGGATPAPLVIEVEMLSAGLLLHQRLSKGTVEKLYPIKEFTTQKVQYTLPATSKSVKLSLGNSWQGAPGFSSNHPPIQIPASFVDQTTQVNTVLTFQGNMDANTIGSTDWFPQTPVGQPYTFKNGWLWLSFGIQIRVTSGSLPVGADASYSNLPGQLQVFKAPTLSVVSDQPNVFHPLEVPVTRNTLYPILAIVLGVLALVGGLAMRNKGWYMRLLALFGAGGAVTGGVWLAEIQLTSGPDRPVVPWQKH